MCECVRILNTFYVKKIHTHNMYRNRRKKVKLGGVMEASGLGGNCFKSMLMEISEFQETQDHYSKKRWSIRWF